MLQKYTTLNNPAEYCSKEEKQGKGGLLQERVLMLQRSYETPALGFRGLGFSLCKNWQSFHF